MPKLKGLNGWYRLWIFSSLAYALVVSVITYLSLPSSGELTFTDILPHVSDRSLNLLHNAAKEQRWKETVVDGERISVPAQLEPTSERDFTQDYRKAQKIALRGKQVTHVVRALGWWAVPCLLLLALGLGIAWVRRGFKRQAP